MLYTKENIPELKKYIKVLSEKSDMIETNDWGGGDEYDTELQRIPKLIELIETGVNVKDYSEGLVLLNDKYVVSLVTNKWRVLGKNTWYFHKKNILEFVTDYIVE